jgi:hypothetical protein
VPADADGRRLLRQDRDEGKGHGEGETDKVWHDPFPQAFDLAVDRLDGRELLGRDHARGEEIACRLARVLADHTLGDDEEEQSDQQLEICREVEEEVLPGGALRHLAHENGQHGEHAPRHGHQDEDAGDQIDGTPAVDSEVAEHAVDNGHPRRGRRRRAWEAGAGAQEGEG